jgi:hypothetical protein
MRSTDIITLVPSLSHSRYARDRIPKGSILFTRLGFLYFKTIIQLMPVPEDERSKARVYGRSLAGIAGSNTVGGMDGYPL